MLTGVGCVQPEVPGVLVAQMKPLGFLASMATQSPLPPALTLQNGAGQHQVGAVALDG